MNVSLRAQHSAVTTLRAITTSRFLILVPPLVLACAALIVAWQYDPLHRPLTEDPGIFAYLSQLVAFGLAPHKYAFNEQASLTFLIGGAAMRLGDLFGLHPILSFRFAAILNFVAIALLTYFVTYGFTRSQGMGFVAGAILIGFEGLGMRAATTLEPKAVMLVFGLAALVALQKRKWGFAGACAAAAGLAWQIAWGYLVVVLLLVFIQGGANWKERTRATLGAIAFAFGVMALYAAYFVAQNAFNEMLAQTFLAPLLMHSANKTFFAVRLAHLKNTFLLGYGSHAIFGILGVSGLLIWLAVQLRLWEPRQLLARARFYFFQNHRTAGTLLVSCGFVFYSFLDFQNYPDWFPLLPYIALFAAWLLCKSCATALRFLKASPSTQRAVYFGFACILLVFSAAHAFFPKTLPGRQQGITWQMQQDAADQVNALLPPDAKVWLIGKAELLFFMQRQNLNKYIYLIGNVDAAIDYFEPNGFKGMVARALEQKPALLALARLQPRKFASRANLELINHVPDNWTGLHACRALGSGKFFVAPDQADALLASNRSSCLRR
ncbi:MAG: hypothetical protein EYC68_13095 [Chloroflexota bacterium]|nr:MAG: hypothetical protein EYC68_13095 [Chloroflexota bacterium]